MTAVLKFMPMGDTPDPGRRDYVPSALPSWFSHRDFSMALSGYHLNRRGYPYFLV